MSKSAIQSSDVSIDDVAAQVAKLRAEVDALAKDRVPPAIAGLAERAEAMVGEASDLLREKVDVVSAKAGERPLAAMLIAAGVGVVVGRFLR